MFLFGVTGGIGAGKTTVCRLLRESGVPILEADPLAKELTNRLPEIRQALTAEFGADVYAENGELNKERLSEIVFSDPEKRRRVNQIIHPHVLQAIRHEAERLQREEGHELVGVEAALIYESGMEQMLDAVVVVTAPLDKRIAWLQQRNQLTRAEVEKRMQAQMPVAEKIKRADYVLENDGSLDQLRARVHALLDWLQKHVAGR